MSDPGYTILSTRYANKDHTAVVARTIEAGDVAASERDRPKLWARIHRCCPAVTPYNPNALVQPPSVIMESEPEIIPLAEPEPPTITPALYGHGSPPQVTNLKLTTLQNILTAAENGPPINVPPLPVPPQPLMQPILPPGGKGWRQQAKAAVLDAVSKTNARLAEGRGLYEQALMARNGRVEPLAGLKIAASIQGVKVEVLTEQLIAEYEAAGRRTNYVHARQLQAIRDIDAAQTGDEADAIARQAIKDIMGEDE